MLQYPVVRVLLSLLQVLLQFQQMGVMKQIVQGHVMVMQKILHAVVMMQTLVMTVRVLQMVMLGTVIVVV